MPLGGYSPAGRKVADGSAAKAQSAI